MKIIKIEKISDDCYLNIKYNEYEENTNIIKPVNNIIHFNTIYKFDIFDDIINFKLYGNDDILFGISSIWFNKSFIKNNELYYKKTDLFSNDLNKKVADLYFAFAISNNDELIKVEQIQIPRIECPIYSYFNIYLIPEFRFKNKYFYKYIKNICC